MYHTLNVGDIMQLIYTLLLSLCLMINNSMGAQPSDVDFYQLINNSKEQIKWDCARLVYLLVQNTISSVTERFSYITLYQQVKKVFDSGPMREVLEITNLLAPKAEIYAMAAAIARENNSEDAVLVLQIAAEYAQRGWFSRHASAISYIFGAICGYVGSSYVPLNTNSLLSYIHVK